MASNSGNKRTKDFDQQVGSKIRELRTAIGMSRHELAASCGVTHQQINKYENGKDRVPVSRLNDICNAMGYKINECFDEPSEEFQNVRSGAVYERLFRNFIKIKDKKVRDSIATLVKAVSEKE